MKSLIRSSCFTFPRIFFTFMRQNILEKNLLSGNVPLTNLVIEVALSILESGSNVYDVPRFINATVEVSRSGCSGNSAMEAQVEEFAVLAFGRMLEFSVRADDAVLSFNDRERLVFFSLGHIRGSISNVRRGSLFTFFTGPDRCTPYRIGHDKPV
ncbi:hypothetical protein C4B63_150g47 [Trypanosoma cruzi]|uniref:Uncharacterized protein n=1 Tax=Trypanosoma cruzi TaxID=5693 RepID=A0A2V2UNK4_TRYCR|nr:hypothetical protein C4B63_150g47 [Trypanosoma cruzi]